MAAAALGCLIGGTFVRGDDTPAPAPATGTISGVVSVSMNGTLTPVAGATVRLMAPKKAATAAPPANNNDTPAPGDAPKKRAKPLQETTTGTDGTYSFSNVAPGDYGVTASLKGTGNGKAKATVTAGATDTVNITLEARGTGGKKPPTTN